MAKLRRLGDVTSDLEQLLQELTHKHDMQWHEILFLVYGYLQVHCPEGREHYIAGGHPVLYYGPAEGLK